MIESYTNIFPRRDIVIYTAIFNEYDDLKELPAELPEQCDFICFTDNRDLKSGDYTIVYCDTNDTDSARTSRKYKLLPHLFLPSGYTFSIWADASIRFNNFEVDGLIRKYLHDYSWAAFLHPKRKCIYAELEACARLNKDNLPLMHDQVARYRGEGYPKGNGLTSNSFLVRRHNDPGVIRVSEEWWAEVEENSARDQLSFCYVAWRNNFTYALIRENIWENKYFTVLEHK